MSIATALLIGKERRARESGIGHSIEDCIYKAKWGMKRLPL